MSELYIGVMSGTSLDGIDIVLCEIDNDTLELIHSQEYLFDTKLKNDILNAIHSKVDLKFIGELDTRLGEIYAKTINSFIQNHTIDKTKITAIGLHGQTLWHEPNGEYPFSMQLANSSLITTITGVSVVSDFRQKDIALGGQGAPLTPAFHKFIFSKLDKKVAVLNIGGMANISILSDELIGYDTGCGNVLLDLWITKNKNLKYDKDGEWAKRGNINEKLLKQMLGDEYFKLLAPKSTGREYFNQSWIDTQLSRYLKLEPQDVQATLLALTSKSISNEVKKTDTNLLIVCGGGVKNKALMDSLDEELKYVEVVSSDECGVSSDFMEAMAFAWLAYKRIHKQKVELKTVTGARKNTILGCIYE
jgi:anhydro-N-acetylmuramic acid kinase